MAKKPTVSTITSGHASITALNAIYVALRDAFDNTVSRDGSSPNTMAANLDLNGNAITTYDAPSTTTYNALLTTLKTRIEALNISGLSVTKFDASLLFTSNKLFSTFKLAPEDIRITHCLEVVLV